jgi:MinD-like ATPase involved in chromosome partitioning or flagellar assembly/tetratricopeptide (TPR) repeat protein
MELIAFASGKGGTGKTLMASCLGYALIRAGQRVLMVDADLATDGLSLFLLGPKGVHQISDFNESNTFTGILHHVHPKNEIHFEPRRINRTGADSATDHGVIYEALISGTTLYGDDPFKDRPSSNFDQGVFRIAVANLFSAIRKSGRYDYVIVDTRGGFSYESTDLCALADSFLVVTDPDVTSFYQDRNLLKRISNAAEELGSAPVLRSIIVNRATEWLGEDHSDLNSLEVSFRLQLEREFPIKFSETHPIPADIEVLQAYKTQRIPYLAAPASFFSFATLSAFGDILKIVTTRWTTDQIKSWNVLVASISDAIEKRNRELASEREAQAEVIVELAFLRKENSDQKKNIQELKEQLTMVRSESRHDREPPRSSVSIDETDMSGRAVRDKVEGNKYVQRPALSVVNALHQLPTPPSDFTGRQAELKELLEAVKTGGVTISGLQGLGGVGKTTLALKLAEQLKADYPDAQFYLDLKGVNPQALTPRDAMAYIVRAYNPTTQLPEKEEDVAALYRSVLDGKRALLLMDNARDAHQVAPLVPPPGSLLLVTSRRHFTLPGLVEMNLDKLPPRDARDLLLRIAPRLKKEKGDQVDELARLCGYLPLALRAVASALQEKKNISAADYAARLKETGRNLVLKEIDPSLQRSVGAALQSSYDLLSKDLRQSFRFLSVFPDTFDLAAAAAVWDVPPENVQDPLSELLAYSLVDFDEVTNRYRLHNLAGLFAGQLLNAEEQNAAQKRHAGYYLDLMQAANDLCFKGGESVTQGLALFDSEWTNIHAGHEWVVAHQQEDDTASAWCWRYPDEGAYCLSLRQHPRERIQWLESALMAARRLKQRAWEGAALGNLGIAYESLGEYRRAVEYHEQTLKIAREIGDRRSEGNALGNLGMAYESIGEYRRAIEYDEQNLKIAREISDRRSEGTALRNLGIAYESMGEYRRAIEYQEQQLKIAKEIGDRLGESRGLGSLGNAYFSLGKHRRALEYHEQSLQIAREIGDRRGEAHALFNSAFALDQLGDRSAAIARAEAALKIYEAIESPFGSKARDLLAEWRGEDKASGKIG